MKWSRIHTSSLEHDVLWQRGRVERHGQVVKQMLTRIDNQKAIADTAEFDQVFLHCFQAKNALIRRNGYSPEQIVLGKSPRLPASLMSDDQAAAHALASHDSLEGEACRKSLERRAQARQAFIEADYDDSGIIEFLCSPHRHRTRTPEPFGQCGERPSHWLGVGQGSRARDGQGCYAALQDRSSQHWKAYETPGLGGRAHPSAELGVESTRAPGSWLDTGAASRVSTRSLSSKHRDQGPTRHKLGMLSFLRQTTPVIDS